MPLGIVSDDIFELEINRTPKINPDELLGVIEPLHKGRGETKETPELIREIIGENAITEGRAATQELTKFFGLSDSSQSAYSNGSTGTSNYKKPSHITEHLNRVRGKITKRASHKLLGALDSLTQDDIDSAKPIEKAQIAKTMSGIIKDMIPESPQAAHQSNAPAIVIYAPKLATEDKYEVLDIRAVEESK